MQSLEIQGFSYEERHGLLPTLTTAFAECGGWIIDLALEGLQSLRVCRADGRQRERGSKGGLADRHGGLLLLRAHTRF